MKPSTLINLMAVASAVALVALAGGYGRDPVDAAQTTVVPTLKPTKPPVTPSVIKVAPTPISGGAWQDFFWNTSELSTTSNVQISDGNLTLKVVESLNWKQTWTSHFALGEFFQTRAISDSVQLAPVDGSEQYYMTGVYTSTVFDAGRPVDWLSADWNILSVNYPPVHLSTRTGNTFPPDGSWSDWTPFTGYGCLCTITQIPNSCSCHSDMRGIESGRYLQYRATFDSSDPNRTPALTDVNYGCGLHTMTGVAISKPIAPIDLRSWKQVAYHNAVFSSRVPVVDVLSPDGTVLLSNAHSGDSLASLDPSTHRSIQLRATFVTDDPAYTPELNTWSLTWQIGARLNFPVIGR